jgi:hypothetical protein
MGAAASGTGEGELPAIATTSTPAPSTSRTARPAPALALTKKSPKIVGGVVRLDGRGPFHALSRTGCLGILKPGGEVESVLPGVFKLSTRGGDSDLALGETIAAGGPEPRSQVRAAAVG